MTRWPNEVYGQDCPLCGAGGVMAWTERDGEVIGKVEFLTTCDCRTGLLDGDLPAVRRDDGDVTE